MMMAQNNSAITFEMKLSKPKLGLNERLRVDFVMNRDGDNFNPPDFNGFRVVMGPSQSISSSWINGVRSYSKSYSYTLAPTAKGKFTMKQASIVIGGVTYKSLTKEVEVTTAVDKPSDQMTADDVADENLHLVAEIWKTNPFLNEAITVIYKLYVSPNISVSNYQPLDNPTYNNFWSQDIKVSSLSAQNGTYKGKPYRYVILKRVVLYPQKSGKLDIEPLSLDVTVDVPTGRRDFFGGRIYAQTNKTVSAGNRTINVKSLPLADQPANFNGAVGDFYFSVTTSKTSLNATESLQATVEVNGKGNLKLFKLPELVLPSALEVYEPEFTEGVRTTLAGMQGKVSNQYTVVPAFKGKYPIAPLIFSFFNPTTAKYITLTSDEIVVNVLEGPLSASNNSATDPNNAKQSVISSGTKFNFIKLTPNLSSTTVSYFFGSTNFYIWLLSPLLLIPLAIAFRKKKEAKAGDIVGNKVRRANKLARKYLSAAKKELGNKDSFYVALDRALHNYLKAKLKLETSEFSKDKIVELLGKKSIETNTIQSFTALLENCEAARYSPFSDVQMQADYEKASEVISLMDKQL
ncbi:BatD family protein [Maribacter sp. ACAM166]|uniref:BatD family protein n=1 Tax=Maribacter sp. ACAM166 TaxID=2508996 RepID=UPI0010FD4AF1|nr:BatD family protein [Maribacter sp. ACAM166]TLP73140.1 protein BatD [Maribacter sp. ACAM166]